MQRKIHPGVSGVGQTTSQDPREHLDEKETQERELSKGNVNLGTWGWGKCFKELCHFKSKG